MQTIIMSLQEAIALSLDAMCADEHEASFKINVNDSVWTAYAVSISYRDILLYCDKGTATYLVDSYGDRHVAELFDWSKLCIGKY